MRRAQEGVSAVSAPQSFKRKKAKVARPANHGPPLYLRPAWEREGLGHRPRGPRDGRAVDGHAVELSSLLGRALPRWVFRGPRNRGPTVLRPPAEPPSLLLAVRVQRVLGCAPHFRDR
eukprot:5093962-Alexandrium_andersonii.AAC.1